MKLTIKHFLIALAGLLLIAGPAQAQRKDRVSGSLFSEAIAAAGLGVLIGDSVTNLPAAVINPIAIPGAEEGIAIAVDLVGAVGNTNGVLQIALAVNVQGDTFTTPTNFFVLRPPVSGTTRSIWVTNIPAAALVGVNCLKLQQIASTNTSAYTISNITYGAILTR